MSKISELIVRITGDTRGLNPAIKGAQKDVAKFQTSLAGLGRTLGITFGAAGLIAATQSIVNARVRMDSLERGLLAVAGSSRAAEQQLRNLRDVAKLPGLGLEEAVRGAINLQAVGFSAARSEQILRTFGNALATVGRGREDLNEVIRQLGQLASRGKVTADNLKPIIERVPQVAAVIKKEFGTIDTEALQKLGISSEQLIQVLLRELGKLPPVTTGIANNIENLGDSWARVLDAMGKVIEPTANSIISHVADMAESFADFVDEVRRGETAFQRFSKSVGGDININATAFEVLRFSISRMGEALGSLGTNPGMATVSLMTGYLKGILGEATLVAPQVATVGEAMRQMGAQAVVAGKGTTQKAEALTKAKTAAQMLREELETRHKEALRSTIRLFADATTRTGEFGKAIELATEAIADNSAALRALPVDANRAIGELNRLREQLNIEWNPTTVGGGAGITLPPINGSDRAAMDARGAYEAAARAAKRSGRIQTEAMQQVSLVVNDVSRNIAKLIFEGGKFKDVMKNAASEIAQAFTRVLIQRALKPLIDGLDTAIAKSNILSKIFGVGSSAAGGASSAVGGIGGAAGGAGGIAGGAASGAAGWVGAVGSIATAVSSIFGNFQMAAMNRTLDIIAKHTLQAANQLIYGLQPQVNQYLPALSGIHDRLMEIRQFGVGVYAQPGYAAIGGGGSVGLTINGNIYGGPAGLDQLFNEFVSRLKAKGFKI